MGQFIFLAGPMYANADISLLKSIPISPKESWAVPMFPDASAAFIPLMFALSAVAAIYTSLVALVQTDMKKLIAYSSVAHMRCMQTRTFPF